MKIEWLIIAGIMVCSGCTVQTHYRERTTVPHPSLAPSLDKQTKTAYLKRINRLRSEARRCGSAGYFPAAPEVKWSDALYRAAYEHSNDMKQSGLFSHRGSHTLSDRTAVVQHLAQGSSLKERIENNGYIAWKRIGENIAEGSSTADGVLERWIRSDRHCANMMNPVFTHVGMAHTGKNNASFWTQTFAAHQ